MRPLLGPHAEREADARSFLLAVVSRLGVSSSAPEVGLMTVALLERSHGKVRIVAQRPSDQKPVDTEARRGRDHDADGRFKQGNRAAFGGRARQDIAKHLRAAHRRAVAARSRGEAPAPEDLVLEAAWRRYEAARRELGAESLLVLTPLARWAEDEERVRDLGERADRAGVDTPEGERLLARRDALEGKANRAMSAALAAAGALSTKPAKRRGPPPGFEAESEASE